MKKSNKSIIFFLTNKILQVLMSVVLVSLNGELGRAKESTAPFREVAIIVREGGYSPANITVYAGETVRVFLTTVGSQKGCVIIPSKEIFMAAPPNRVIYQDIHFKNPGKVFFYCPEGNLKGQFLVAGRARNRSPAGVGDKGRGEDVDERWSDINEEKRKEKKRGPLAQYLQMESNDDWNPKDF